MLLALLISFAVSLCVTLFVIRSSHIHGHISGDHDLSGPQKFHAGSVPRIGGLGILLGLIAGCLAVWTIDRSAARLGGLLLLCGIPAFAAGVVEDITKSVSPRRRLVATAFSAGLAVWLVSAIITRTDLLGVDWLLSFTFAAVIFTVFVVTGIANALNIIDGFNGLASMCAAMMLAAIAYVGFQANDYTIAILALAGVGALAGFFIWNFPAGLIFLGDGGAYFVGFYLAELSILLVARNPVVSPLFPLLLCIYPVVETLFSIYRKKVIRGISPGIPDGVHLHMLVYKRLMRWTVGPGTARELTRRNSLTSPYLWALCSLAVIPSILFWNNSAVLGAFIALFAITYLAIYWSIVRFRAPRWLVFRKSPRNRRR